jgi:hypothetical protein
MFSASPHLEDQGVDGRMGSKRTLGRSVGWGGGGWSGFNWLRIGIVGGMLWVRWWTLGFWRHGVSFLHLLKSQKYDKTSDVWCLRIRGLDRRNEWKKRKPINEGQCCVRSSTRTVSVGKMFVFYIKEFRVWKKSPDFTVPENSVTWTVKAAIEPYS